MSGGGGGGAVILWFGSWRLTRDFFSFSLIYSLGNGKKEIRGKEMCAIKRQKKQRIDEN